MPTEYYDPLVDGFGGLHPDWPTNDEQTNGSYNDYDEYDHHNNHDQYNNNNNNDDDEIIESQENN